MQHDSTVTLGLHRKSLHAIRVPACRKCGAPGCYRNHPSIRDGWPGCYDARLSPHDSRPAGAHCPNCGARRPGDDDLGEINADMPLWVWKGALALKWMLIKFKRLKGALR